MLANETKVAFFTVDIDSKAQPGKFTIDLRFDWTQDTDSLNDTTNNLTLTVLPAAVPVALIVVALVVVGGAGGFLYMRRRKARAAASQSAAKTSK